MAGSINLKQPLVQRAQAKIMLAKRLSGSSLSEIAEQFQVSPQTINRRIKLAMREGLLDEATDTVIDDLVPKALAVFRAALLEGDVDCARDILFGTGILSKTPKPAQTTTVTATTELSLEQYRALLLKEHDTDTNTTDLLPASLSELQFAPETPREEVLLEPREDVLAPVTQPPTTPTSSEGI